MTLLRTESPLEDESGLGYYRRLAGSNALLGWPEVAALAGVDRTRQALLGSPEHVASQLGLELEWSRSALRQEQVSRDWRGLRRSQTDAVCPDCLVESAHLRISWEHAFVVACPCHKVLLLDRCEGCGEPLSNRREHIQQCSCGQDLRRMSTVRCTPSQQWLSALISSNGHSTSGVSPKVVVGDLGVLGDLVRTLCLLVNPSVQPPRRNSFSPKSVSEAIELLAPLDGLLSDWPQGFEQHIRERMAVGPKDARTLNSLLGQWYQHLKRAGQSPGLQPFLETVIKVADRDFDGALGLDMAGRAVAKVTGYVRVATAATMAGVGRDQLLSAAKDGLIQYRTARFGTRGLVYEIPQTEVDRVRNSRAEWLNAADAAGAAGVPLSVLERMMSAGVVVFDRYWRRDVFKGGIVRRSSIEDLLTRLNGSVVSRSRAGQDVIAWAELTSRRLGDKGAIEAVMRAASEGALLPTRRGQDLGKVQFLRDEVMRYFGTPKLEAGLSVQQLALATGWKWESIAHWIDEGLLKSTSIMLRGQPCRVVSPQQLLEFRREFLPLADLARAMGTTSVALVDQLPGLSVIGAKPLPGGVRRGGLLRIAELGRLALEASAKSVAL